MARIRTIKPEFFKHEDLYDLEVETGLPVRLAFPGLWTQCDREGRFEWRPRQLKADILPYDDVDFSRVLHAWATRGFIVPYRVNGKIYGMVPSWRKHQVVNNRERNSEIPPPPKNIPDINELLTRDGRVIDACPSRDRRVADASRRVPHGALQEGKGNKNKKPGKKNKKPKRSESSVAISSTLPRASLIPQAPALDENDDAALRLIKIYDDAVREVYGPEQARPWPAATDLTTAQRWFSWGATAELSRHVLTSRLMARHSRGGKPPMTMNYFDEPIREAITNGGIGGSASPNGEADGFPATWGEQWKRDLARLRDHTRGRWAEDLYGRYEDYRREVDPEVLAVHDEEERMKAADSESEAGPNKGAS